MLYQMVRNEEDLTKVVTSNVTNMEDVSIFYSHWYPRAVLPLNGNISNWDVSNVTNMERMFSGSVLTKTLVLGM